MSGPVRVTFANAIAAVADSMAIMCKGSGLSAQTDQHQEEFRRCAAEALAKAFPPIAYDDIHVPADIQEFGDRHSIPQFANATYRNGFMDGYLSRPSPSEGSR